jgi:1,4-alpha-glucan branching enzyme
VWVCEIDAKIPEYSALKVEVQLQDGSYVDRIPAWINFTRQNNDKSFDGVYVELGQYKWQFPRPAWPNDGISIYECHIGMSGIEEQVHSFNHFRENVLPRIKKLGYNVVQIMGVIEHPYYGSFGYHCSNFFSVSSRFGTPEDFKKLVDVAHGLDIKIIIDLVHSHAAKNVLEGINMWDGTDYQYFHGGAKGNHPLWDSRVFDYSKY